MTIAETAIREPPHAAMPLLDATLVLDSARDVICAEARTVMLLEDGLDEAFLTCIRHLASCEGRIVGMGKSRLIGQKISATFAAKRRCLAASLECSTERVAVSQVCLAQTCTAPQRIR